MILVSAKQNVVAGNCVIDYVTTTFQWHKSMIRGSPDSFPIFEGGGQATPDYYHLRWLRVCILRINPRRACAARVTVVGIVCAVKSHLTSRMSNRALNEHVYSVAKICGDLSEASAFRRYERKSYYANLSGLPAVSFLCSTHSEAPGTVLLLPTTFSLIQNGAY